jgi:hypothetical protein
MRWTFQLSLRSLFFFVALCFAIPASAQYRANLQGSVTDAAGAAIVDATVTLTSKDTGKSQIVKTSGEGFYRFSNIAPGNYTLTAEQSGFKKGTIENLVVKGEETQGADLTLEPGQVTETVTIKDDPNANLQTEDANVSKAINTQEVRRLPQQGRDPYELLRLTPGIFGDAARGGDGRSVGLPNSVGPGGSNNSVFQVENQPQISANGQRVSANNFQIDGVSVNSLTHGGAAVVTPNQESVKEITVSSSSYSAEDGRNSGAQIKVVSQSGTNDFHGSAFIKYDSPKLNAFNKFPHLPGTTGPERVNRLFRQYGGSFGGPLPGPRFGEGAPPAFKLLRNKAFFFFSTENINESSSTNSVQYIETPQYRAQVIAARPGSIAARLLSSPGITPRIVGVTNSSCANFAAGRCQVVAGGLDLGSPGGAIGQYVPINNYVNNGVPVTGLVGGGLDGIPDVQQVIIATPRSVRAHQYNARFDITPTQKDTITFSTYITQSTTVSGSERPLNDVTTAPTNSAFALSYIRILSPSMVNEARFNFTRFAYNEVQSSASTNFGIPRIEIEQYPFNRITFGAPQSEATPGIFAENTFEFRDVLNKVVGNHALKFGGEIRKEQDNNNLNGASRPLYTFAGLFNLANDTPLFYQINADPRTGGPANAQRYFRSGGYGIFAQDDWKYRPNLTLNIGLRYEYFTPLSEKNGTLSNLVFGPHGLADAKIVTTDRLFNPDKNNFAPRLGFAYSPNFLGENKLVLRGGFGISYNRLPDVLFANSRGNPPFFARFGICCGTAPSSSTNDFSTPFAGGQILYALGTSNSPFSYPANPALASGINPATGAPNVGQVEIYGSQPDVPNAYVYSYSFEGQYSLPYKLTAELGYQGSSSHKLIRLVNQRFIYPTPGNFFASAVYFPTPDVNANYNAMNARLSRRFAQGFQFDAIYRWSKSIDTLSNEGPGFLTNQTYPQDLRTERGPSDFDVRHYFVGSGLWDLPFFNGRKDAVGKLLGGWQVDGIVTWHTGFPWTPHSGFCQTTPGGPGLCPTRPIGYKGGALDGTSNDAFLQTNGNFPGGGLKYFIPGVPGNASTPPQQVPGIGRNSFRGPRYFAVDMSLGKRTGLPSFLHLGEAASLEFKANFFNIFNNLNLKPFQFDAPVIEDPKFGRAQGGLSGRVVELQARFYF